MISFKDITKLFSFDLEGKWCIEIEFLVKGYSKYQSCWMGKMPNKADKKKNYTGMDWYLIAPKHTTMIISKTSLLRLFSTGNH